MVQGLAQKELGLVPRELGLAPKEPGLVQAGALDQALELGPKQAPGRAEGLGLVHAVGLVQKQVLALELQMAL